MLKRPFLLAAGVLGGSLVLGGVALATTGPDVPRGTTIAGLDVGGRSTVEARALLEQQLAPRATATVELAADGQRLTLDPARAGLRLDLDATLDDAASVSPLDRLRALVGAERDVEPTTDVDEVALQGQLALVARGFDRAPREGAVRFTGTTPVRLEPLAGRVLDADAATEEIADAWLADADAVELPVEVTPVRSTTATVDAAESYARTAVSAPVAVQVGAGVLQVQPGDVAKALLLEAGDDGEIAPVLDGTKLVAALGARLDAVEQEPVDATFDVTSGAPVVVPGKDGQSVDPSALATAVSDSLSAAPPRRTSVSLTVALPRVTTELAKTLGVREKVGEFTTFHPCCRPRVTNIHRIADIVDGHVVLPGETYSLNGDVGERDRKRGFVEAPQILEGQFVDRVGGGVSQFATTLYNATFYAGMEDVEHKPHSYFISRYPAGREATVSFPQPDLKWKNDSPHGALIVARYTARSITVEIWGTKRYDEVLSVSSPRTRMRTFGTQYVQRADCTAASGANGFDITITRIFKIGGKEVKRDSAKHRYLPEPRFICGAPPRKAAPKPTASATPAPQPSPTG